jgi:site-specific recombinase XerD
MRAGLHDGHLYRFDEMSAIFRVTHERLRQIAKAALVALATSPDLGPFVPDDIDDPPLPLPANSVALSPAVAGHGSALTRAQARATLFARPTPSGDSLGQLRASWLGTLESAATREAYSRDLNQFLDYCIEHDLDPLAIRVPQFNMFTTWLRLQNGQRGHPYSKRTRARKIAAVSSFYHHLIEVEAVDRHPVTKKARPKIKKTPPNKVITREDTLALIQDAETGHRTLGSRCATLVIELLFTMGIRVSEVCGLDIDQLTQTIGDDGRTYWTITFTAKGDKEKVRAIPEDVVHRRLMPYLAQRPRPATMHDGPALLLTLDGHRLDRRQIAELLARAHRRGLTARRVTPHFGRHTFNRRAWEKRVPIEVRSHALGHESIVTTFGYGQVSDDIVNDPSHLVAAALYDEPASDSAPAREGTAP